MGWIVPTPAGSYRVNWRDPSGRQRAKTLPTKREAKAFLSRVEADASRGTYVDPHAGRVLLRDYAAEWLAGRTVEARTKETTDAMLRTHVLPRWGDWPLTKIDHLSVQQWVAEPATRRKPATVVAATRTGTALRRSTFRRRVWVPAVGAAGLPMSLRFHDLRHSYATWLVSDGVPVNVVQRLMGHEQASTTLNRYVHAPRDYDERVRDLFDEDDPDDGAAGALVAVR